MKKRTLKIVGNPANLERFGFNAMHLSFVSNVSQVKEIAETRHGKKHTVIARKGKGVTRRDNKGNRPYIVKRGILFVTMRGDKNQALQIKSLARAHSCVYRAK